MHAFSARFSQLSDRLSLHLPYGTEFPPDLAAVVAAWPDLTEALKAGILAMVKAASGTRGWRKLITLLRQASTRCQPSGTQCCFGKLPERAGRCSGLPESKGLIAAKGGANE